MTKKSILIVGVGGQGTLLSSRILGHAAIRAGHDVKVSEVHGMSQRGGSVVTYVKYGDQIASPIIGLGEADVILAFELLEAYRALPYLKKGGKIIVNTQRFNPMPVITGAAEYPGDILEKLRQAADVSALDALALAQEAGSPKAANVALIGVMARETALEKQLWLDTIRETVPEKFLEINLRAFELGYQA